MDYDAAVKAALATLEAGQVETAWTDALASSQGDVAARGADHARRHDDRAPAAGRSTPAPRLLPAFTGLGGTTGWLYIELGLAGLRGCSIAWSAASACGAAGAIPTTCAWATRSTSGASRRSNPARLLRLRAEMKVPGRAWLQFQARRQPDGRTLLSQTAFFAPKGLWGLVTGTRCTRCTS